MKQALVQPHRLHKFLVHQEVEAIELGRDSATLRRGHDSVVIDLASATLSSRPNWLVLRAVTLMTPNGTFDLAGLPPDAVAALEAAVQDAKRRKNLLTSLSGQADRTGAALSAWEELAARDAYLPFRDVHRWRAGVGPLDLPTGDDADILEHLPEDQQRRLRRVSVLSREPQMAAAVT